MSNFESKPFTPESLFMKTIKQLKDELALDWLDISTDGKINLHIGKDLTPEQLQEIVDLAKQLREIEK